MKYHQVFEAHLGCDFGHFLLTSDFLQLNDPTITK